MTLEEWEAEKDRELDEQLRALFHAVDAPSPRAEFVSRTMDAVRRSPLPAGRRPLRRSRAVPIGWVALVAGGAAAAYIGINNQRLVIEIMSSLVALGLSASLTVVHAFHTSSLVFDALATIGRIVSRAASTREATAGLIALTLVAAVSLSMLQRLLVSGEESSSW
jgi:hypothetical protein